jgi:hypothetical protein
MVMPLQDGPLHWPNRFRRSAPLNTFRSVRRGYDTSCVADHHLNIEPRLNVPDSPTAAHVFLDPLAACFIKENLFGAAATHSRVKPVKQIEDHRWDCALLHTHRCVLGESHWRAPLSEARPSSFGVRGLNPAAVTITQFPAAFGRRQ